MVGIRRGEEGSLTDGRKERRERGGDESDQRRPAEYVHARETKAPAWLQGQVAKPAQLVAVALCSVLSRAAVVFVLIWPSRRTQLKLRGPNSRFSPTHHDLGFVLACS